MLADSRRPSVGRVRGVVDVWSVVGLPEVRFVEVGVGGVDDRLAGGVVGVAPAGVDRVLDVR